MGKHLYLVKALTPTVPGPNSYSLSMKQLDESAPKVCAWTCRANSCFGILIVVERRNHRSHRDPTREASKWHATQAPSLPGNTCHMGRQTNPLNKPQKSPRTSPRSVGEEKPFSPAKPRATGNQADRKPVLTPGTGHGVNSLRQAPAQPIHLLEQPLTRCKPPAIAGLKLMQTGCHCRMQPFAFSTPITDNRRTYPSDKPPGI